ncbi:MAG: hypothetical protein RJB13_2266 [Pseudomonadota bacterium]|jgi:hypothetical protein
MDIRNRTLIIRLVAVGVLLMMVIGAALSWPVVKFLYRERTLAEAVRRYADLPALPMTADDDVRSYIVKLAEHHRIEMTEGDVEIDYIGTPEDFGVPTRIGYTLRATIDFHGLKVVPVLAQRSFAVSIKKRSAAKN